MLKPLYFFLTREPQIAVLFFFYVVVIQLLNPKIQELVEICLNG